MGEVIIRAHFFGDRWYDEFNIMHGETIHICCESCGDWCFWHWSGSEISEIEEHVNYDHEGAEIIYICDLDESHDEFDNLSDFIDHLRNYN